MMALITKEVEVELGEDLILEILSYLPLKSAVQCKTLNKNFQSLISHPSFLAKHAGRLPETTVLFHCSADHAKVFYHIPIKKPSSSSPPPPPDQSEISLPHLVQILASFNGLVLLRFLVYESLRYVYFVSNPITNSYHRLISSDPPSPSLPHEDPKRRNFLYEHAGLAVDPHDVHHQYNYKVITVKPKIIFSRKMDVKIPNLAYEFKIFSSDTNSWGNRPILCRNLSEEFATVHKKKHDRNGFLISNRTVPAYLHGCLHWLRQRGDILVFDTNKKQSFVIKKPPNVGDHESTWVGVAQGMITLVSSSALKRSIEIVVWGNENKKENYGWVVRARISNNVNIASYNFKCPNTNIIHNYRINGLPIFFDGKRLVMQIRGRRTKGNIYAYDDVDVVVVPKEGGSSSSSSSCGWRKIGSFPDSTDKCRVYVPFAPTLATAVNQQQQQQRVSGAADYDDDRITRSIELLSKFLVKTS